MRFRILGTMRVWDGDRWAAVGAAQQRLLLAVLLVEGGAVSTERLVEEIWGGQPPRGAYGTLHGYVFRLRRILGGGPEGPLVRRDGGYELLLPDGDLDADIFAGLVAGARRELTAGRTELAASRLSQALGLWRGRALADVASTPVIMMEAARLERARLEAAELRVHTWLRLGRHADVVDSARRLTEEHPLRESLWEHLVFALSALGRRGEALEAYRRARDAMVSTLGLEPGPGLRALQRAVLDDGLAVTPPSSPSRPA
jgi:DNA-binding SARP family transcriptional activator